MTLRWLADRPAERLGGLRPGAARPAGPGAGPLLRRPCQRRGGGCQSPEIASVRERTELGGDQVMVRYTYYEPGEDETEWTSVFHQPVACTGSGERQFTVERTKIGLEVVDMTGPRRTMEPE